MENLEYYKRKAGAYLIIVLAIIILKGYLATFIAKYLTFITWAPFFDFISIFIILVVTDWITKKTVIN